MKRHPANVRRKAPRPLRVDGIEPTPTPPPVSVSPSSLSPAVTSFEHQGPRSRPSAAASERYWPFVLAAVALLVSLLVRRSFAADDPSSPGAVARLEPLAAAVAALPAEALAPLPPPLPEAIDTEPEVPFEAPIAPAQSAVSRADAKVRHGGYTSIPGGVLFTPKTFSSADGAYDLFLHFHGNTRVVEESAEVAGLNAVVAVINLGVGSAPYQDAYAVPGSYEALLTSINHAVLSRGLAHPRLRRLALSSWSAGYGALSTILELRKGSDDLDAILLLDGLHCGYLQEDPSALNPLQLGMFARAAERAAKGELLMSITHSQIDPHTYAPAGETADYLLHAVGGARVHVDPMADVLPHLELISGRGAVAKKLEKKMIPESEGHVGGLHVRGFVGETPEHHMAHLLQMGATVLPELVSRWASKAAN